MKIWSTLVALGILLFSGITYTDSIADSIKKDPLLVVVIMVKDEIDVIKPTLEMYCKADPEGKRIAYLVYDTGTDAWSPTMEKAQELFQEYKLNNYRIMQEPFIDFATSRNRALDLVEQEFPNAVFMLMPDAEWYLHNVEELLDFCQKEVDHQQAHSYLIRIVSTDLDFGTQRLLRCQAGLRFGGVVHETILIGTSFKTPYNIYFELRPAQAGMEKSCRRWQRDKELLLKAHLANPYDSRTCFYLAQTYDCLGDLQNAYKYYLLRTKLIGWDEEDFQAHYRLAQIIDRIKLNDGVCDWPAALMQYLKAFSMRPIRAEPLIKVAVHYLAEREFALAYIFAHRACEIAYPIHDTLFVEKDAYEFTRHDILGQCAWYINEFDLGEQAVREALKAHDYAHLHTNLAFYLNRKHVPGTVVGVAAA